MAITNRDIKYINRDFDQFRARLIEYARTYFPQTYNDFTPVSPGMMFMEQASRRVRWAVKLWKKWGNAPSGPEDHLRVHLARSNAQTPFRFTSEAPIFLQVRRSGFNYYGLTSSDWSEVCTHV